MKNCSELTEKEFADAFEECLVSAKSSMGLNAPIIREFESKQGIPDFVIAVPREGNQTSIQQFKNISFNRLNGFSSVLAALDSEMLEIEQICSFSGLSRNTVKNLMACCFESNLIEKKGAFFHKSNDFTSFPVEFWTFELKLDNWKRAAFQCQQSLAYATRSYIVFPMHMRSLAESKKETILGMKLGLLLFCPNTWEFDLLLEPVRHLPASKSYYYYALLRLASQASFEESELEQQTVMTK